ncbi:bifunctional 2',3'-cyclic-nucleotide 2'-phosphodiesterase/3'-nucleotidase [Undibacterium rugosum]|uniref:Bifunctional 2',3'-cyclic-nucleotide 2'-phosphodiesterase/3'-nucleotidase n=1 Tax=Undibacterium rugosum TaxID=2762291 RepID=A0A923I5F7_9BURK|nr:bifunctional 2',3'-cyclic-nucleotide 2'-phosphodiesterase/3'-nucleotidase [Undibacterium rugosum]MBC3935891.1 bifunctional 2',3'-cyclic-nucleotide 2'-phosphodiesterase/3'-nucleotidase [Undibacterium rugosum]MBR7779327.1 bifunctional 2',3'-cyclic-nucleotide 2'-phosphodiesterase/3'-nucleotidase [Undibacterium rugosum]
MKKTYWATLIPALFPGLILSGCANNNSSSATTEAETIPEGTIVKVSLLETTDLHQNILSYDYYGLKADTSIGLERTAALIQSARAENPNTVLLDDGDVIQGTLLGDQQAVASPVTCAGTLAIHKAMNALKFDGAGVGNHEFNYGLNFLSQITNKDFGITGVNKPNNCGSPGFPVVLSNVVGVASQQPIFNPYSIIYKRFVGTKPDGSSTVVPVNVGIIGFVPPQIMDWDQKNLAGKVMVNGVVESAQKYVPEMRSKGADLVVALSHGGLDASPYSPKMENGSYHLTTTGIDALMLGHSHLIFPVAKEKNGPKLDASLAALPADKVDTVKGLVNGVPAVMAQSWGRRLGIIQLTLKYQSGKWVVQKDLTNVEARGFKYKDGVTIVDADASIAPLVDTEHKATLAYAAQSLGTSTDFGMSAFFSLVGDVSAIQIVNQAQIDYVKNFIANSTDPVIASYKTIPVISCSAPFKAGRNGATDFTDVAPTATPANPVTLQVRNPGDLYLYGNNNVQAVKIKGSDLKNWLETAAKQFGQINPALKTEQDLVPDYSAIYNYDVFYADNNALLYQIDVTKPVGSRIVNLQYAGKTVADSDDFIVATNDYRASGGGSVPGIDGSKTIIKSPDANQAVVSDFVKKQGTVTFAKNGSGRSWSFVKVSTQGPVILRSAPGKLSVATNLGLPQVVSEGSLDASGYAKYAIDLSK